MKKFEIEVPKIRINFQVYLKMKYFMKHFDQEIFALLIIDEEDDTLVVSDLRIPEQSVSGGHCKPTATGLAKILNDLEDEEQGKSEKARGWFHTHGNMGTFFSGVDEKTIKDWGKGSPYVLSIVGAKTDMKTRLDIFSPIKIELEDLDIDVEIEDPNVEEECKKLIENKVQKTIQVPYRRGRGTSGISSTQSLKECPFLDDTSKCGVKQYSKCCYSNAQCPYIKRSTFDSRNSSSKKTTDMTLKEFEKVKSTLNECPYPNPETTCQSRSYLKCQYYNPECPFKNDTFFTGEKNSKITDKMKVLGNMWIFKNGQWILTHGRNFD